MFVLFVISPLGAHRKGRTDEKKEKKERKEQREKPRTSTWPADALIGEEEQNGKQEKEKERNRERVTNPATKDHSVASYSEPILFTSLAHRGRW